MDVFSKGTPIRAFLIGLTSQIVQPDESAPPSAEGILPQNLFKLYLWPTASVRVRLPVRLHALAASTVLFL